MWRRGGILGARGLFHCEGAVSLAEPNDPGAAVSDLTCAIEALYAQAEERADLNDRAMLLTTARGYLERMPEYVSRCRHPSYNLTPTQSLDARWRYDVAKTMVYAMEALAAGSEPDEDLFLPKA